MTLANHPGNIAIFYNALINNDVVAIKRLLSAGFSPNEYLFAQGQTWLMLAAFYGHSEIVNLLLQHGANANVITKKGDFALTCALHSNLLTIIVVLAQVTDPALIYFALSKTNDTHVIKLLYPLIKQANAQSWLANRFIAVFPEYKSLILDGLCSGMIRISSLYPKREIKELCYQLMNMPPETLKQLKHKAAYRALYEFMQAVLYAQYPHLKTDDYRPQVIEELFLNNQIIYAQPFSMLYASDHLKALGGITSLATFSLVLSKKTFVETYLASLTQYLQAGTQYYTSYPEYFRLNIHVPRHVTQLYFNFYKKSWKTLETNHLALFKSANNEIELTDHMYDNCLTKNDILPFCTIIIVEQAFASKMQTIITQWLNDTRMQQLLHVTQDKIDLVDSRGNRWMDIAPKAGNLSITHQLRNQMGFFKRNKTNFMLFYAMLLLLAEVIAISHKHVRQNPLLFLLISVALPLTLAAAYLTETAPVIATRMQKKYHEKYNGIRFFPEDTHPPSSAQAHIAYLV